jgi:putative ABC transport system permease protein
MLGVAYKMLVGEKAKYLGLIFGIAFSTLLMSQQVSMFVGILDRTSNQIKDLGAADLFVLHPEVYHFDVIKPLSDNQLLKVRSIEGVKWAVPLYKNFGVLRNGQGKLQQAVVMGVDDTSLFGKPAKMLMGKWEDLRKPDAVIVDKLGYTLIRPNQPMEIGQELEINDKRIVIVGIVDASPPFFSFPIIFTKFSRATIISPGERNKLSMILAGVTEGFDAHEVAKRIEAQTKAQALTPRDFRWNTIQYYLKNTGIPINFGITVALGFIVGAVICGQTFYIFVIENLKQFAALRAIGVTNWQIMRMVLLQAFIVAFIGYSFGIGLCALFFEATSTIPVMKGFFIRWEIVVGSAAAVAVIITLASFISIRKAMKADPAIVFKG